MSSPDPLTSVVRFRRAQDSGPDGFETAVRELTAGRKRSHWIWYIFPQLDGLGHSSMAVHYGVHGAAEAVAYLRDPILRDRLLRVTGIVATHLRRQPPAALDELMGSAIDAQKLVSSMTLFRAMAQRLNAGEPSAGLSTLAADADEIMRVAAAHGYPPCVFTLQCLAQ